MKKTISILLVLLVVLSLSACGNEDNQKYVGTYTRAYNTSHWEESEKLTLHADGTGSFESHVTAIDDGWADVLHNFKLLSPLESYDVSWEVDSNGYITIYFQGKRYHYYKLVDLRYEYYYDENGFTESYSRVFEMKGNQLFYVDGGNGWLTKTSP